MLETTVDHGPAVINHTGLTSGLPWVLAWAFGPAGTPDDLTGLTAELIVMGVRYPLTVDLPTGTVTFTRSATDTAAYQWTTSYLLLLGDQLEVKGQLVVSQRVTP
jgi:hypothetical protein